MMKRIIAVLLAAALLCGLAGCGKSAVRPADSTPRTPASSAPAAPEPEPQEPEEPAAMPNEETPLQSLDYFGAWSEEKVYSNEALGLSYTLPEGWLYASEEELLGMLDTVLDSDILSDRNKLSTELGKSRIIYAMVTRDPATGNNVQILFESLEGVVGASDIDEKAYADIVSAQQEQMFNESSGATVSIGDAYPAQLGGQDFLVLPVDIAMPDLEAKEMMYLRRIDDRMAIITITVLDGEDAETLAGGASSFGPLGAGAGAGNSGAPTATGDIGRAFSTMFFDYTVVSAESPAEYDGYTPSEGNKLLVLRVKVKNDFGSTLPMYDTDFQLQWGEGDEDYAWAVDAFNDKMMPLEWELADKEEVTYDMLFEAPAAQNDFSLVYLEEYTDKDGNEKTGDFFSADFSLPTPDAA